MRADDLVLVRGIDPTRATLAAWSRRPLPVLGRWAAGALVVALALLAATLLVAVSATPEETWFSLPGVTREARAGDAGHILARNGLVLALHALACVAGFIAGSSLPAEAERYSGLSRRVHDLAGPLAIAFVGAATLFSLGTQAYVIGSHASTVAAAFGVHPATLLVGLLPHALPELVALFLPLAAWLFASRAGRFDELLAATVLTVAVAVPVLLVACVVELAVSPVLLRALVG